MSINAVAPSPSTLTLLTQFTSSASVQSSTQTATLADVVFFSSMEGDPGGSINDPVGSFAFKINGESGSTMIANTGQAYTATVPEVGTISGPSEAFVDAAINVRLNELA